MKPTQPPTGGQGGMLAQPLTLPSLPRIAAYLGLLLLGALLGVAGAYAAVQLFNLAATTTIWRRCKNRWYGRLPSTAKMA